MTTSYFELPRKTQREILQTVADTLNKRPEILEKDIWVCWTLQVLFSMPNAHRMAFKGGTSLSKVYNVIYRFSEDVDVTLDYTQFEPGTRVDDLSRNQFEKGFLRRLGEYVTTYLEQIMMPYLQGQLRHVSEKATLSLQSDGETIILDYPSAFDKNINAVETRVLIEFGGRNVIQPNEKQTIETDIHNYVTDLELPRAKNVIVLSAERTFWEKITLIHAQCQRGSIRVKSEKMARHWYDVAMLANNEVGQSALHNKTLFAEVVEHKKKFYRLGNANYDLCLNKGLTLVPDEASLKFLAADYDSMKNSGMMHAEPPNFDDIMRVVGELQDQINHA